MAFFIIRDCERGKGAGALSISIILHSNTKPAVLNYSFSGRRGMLFSAMRSFKFLSLANRALFPVTTQNGIAFTTQCKITQWERSHQPPISPIKYTGHLHVNYNAPTFTLPNPLPDGQGL